MSGGFYDYGYAAGPAAGYGRLPMDSYQPMYEPARRTLQMPAPLDPSIVLPPRVIDFRQAPGGYGYGAFGDIDDCATRPRTFPPQQPWISGPPIIQKEQRQFVGAVRDRKTDVISSDTYRADDVVEYPAAKEKKQKWREVSVKEYTIPPTEQRIPGVRATNYYPPMPMPPAPLDYYADSQQYYYPHQYPAYPPPAPMYIRR